jgi:hypothetical protein
MVMGTKAGTITQQPDKGCDGHHTYLCFTTQQVIQECERLVAMKGDSDADSGRNPL